VCCITPSATAWHGNVRAYSDDKVASQRFFTFFPAVRCEGEAAGTPLGLRDPRRASCNSLAQLTPNPAHPCTSRRCVLTRLLLLLLLLLHALLARGHGEYKFNRDFRQVSIGL
jgi:hypothetical protein